VANPSAYKLSFVLCSYTGEPIGEVLGASQRKLSRRRNTPGVATIQLQLHDAQALLVQPGLSRLKIYRSATPAELALNPAAAKQLVWYGSLPAENVEEDTDNGTLTAIFWDPRWVLLNRFLQSPASFAATDQGSIVWQVVNTQNLRQDTWLRQGSTTTGIVRDRTYDAGKNVAALIDDMTKVTSGLDLDVVPIDGYTTFSDRRMGTLNTYARQGTDKPNTLLYIMRERGGSGGGGNIMGLKRTYAPLLNSSTQQGTDPDGVASAQTYAIATGFDLLETYDTASDAFTATGLLEKAAGVVSENVALRQILTIGSTTWEAPLPFADYDLGDTIRLSARVGRVVLDRVSMRVDGYDVEADQEGNIKATPILVAA
jgi:hypothetical protein